METNFKSFTSISDNDKETKSIQTVDDLSSDNPDKEIIVI